MFYKILQRTLLVVFAGSFLPVQAVHLNEWTFETELAGLTLSQAANAGTEGAVFAAGGEGFVETDGLGGLLCTNRDAGAAGLWTAGAVLDAPLSSYTSGVYYLRYDVRYDFRSANNNSGTMLGAYFTDSLGNKAAGFSLVYDKGNLTNAVPAERQLIPVPGAAHLLKYGSLTAIAEVDLSGQTAKVWYSLNGTAPTNYSTPSFSTNIALTSIDNLRFHATGDFQPDGSADFANVDNLRIATSWQEVTAPAPDFSSGPDIRIVSVAVTNLAGTSGTDVGETNRVTVVIHNGNAPATNLVMSLTAEISEHFEVESGNLPASLAYSEYATNIFYVIADSNAVNKVYTFNVDVIAAGGVTAGTTFRLTVGSLIDYLTHRITEVSGGSLSGQYEPGETIDITVTSTNSGGFSVSNIVNSLSADPRYFTVSNLNSTVYPAMDPGAATSSVYRVVVDESAPHGLARFSVTNQAGAKVWTNSFSVYVMTHSPLTLKATDFGTYRHTEDPVVVIPEATVVSSGGKIYRFIPDIPYLGTNYPERADLYLPADGGTNYPAIFDIHGGGWLIGDKTWDRANAEAIVSRGFAFFSINYQLGVRPLGGVVTDQGGWPRNILDCKTALRFMRAYADQLKIDPDRIAAMGRSAGGHLALLTGFTAGREEYRGGLLSELSGGCPCDR